MKKKLVYNLEQIQELVAYINGIKVSGIDDCNRISLCADIINKPIEEIEVEDKEGE